MERRHRRDDPVRGISSGAFLILLAVFYLASPNLLDEAVAFIHDFKLIQIAQHVWWLEPITNHSVLYSAAAQFCYVFALVQVAILILRFVKVSYTPGKAKTFSDIMFWLGAGYVFEVLSSGTLAWLSFLGATIVLLGISIVVRSTILLFAFRHRP